MLTRAWQRGAVLTAADLPIVAAGQYRLHEPLARTEVVYAGQPVAMVVAEAEAASEDGSEAVVVDYAPLDPVVDLETAMAPGAPPARERRVEAEGAGVESLHAGVARGGRETPEEELSDNVLARYFYRTATFQRPWPKAMPCSKGASGRAGSTRPTSSRRSRRPGSSRTASWW